MSVLAYLQRCATETLVDERERQRIDRSTRNLQDKLVAHFDSAIQDHFRFGSTTRGTNLPRAFDDGSDVDYMIVFRDSDKAPQTYLDRLRTFADMHFPRSTIRQSHPTMVLELAHINFDLVPAIDTAWFQPEAHSAERRLRQSAEARHPNREALERCQRVRL